MAHAALVVSRTRKDYYVVISVYRDDFSCFRQRDRETATFRDADEGYARLSTSVSAREIATAWNRAPLLPAFYSRGTFSRAKSRDFPATIEQLRVSSAPSRPISPHSGRMKIRGGIFDVPSDAENRNIRTIYPLNDFAEYLVGEMAR